MYAIAGVTGHVGSVAANALLGAGHKVRVIVRDEKKGARFREHGAEVAVADVADVASLEKALRGATGAFLLLPPDFSTPDVYEKQKRVGAALAQAVRTSKLPHVVFLSSVGAQHATGTGPIQGLHHAERALSDTGAKLTILRPTSFMENLGQVLPAARHQGVLPSFGDLTTPRPMVATRDIGELAALALREPPAAKKIYEQVGPRDYTLAEMAEIVGKALGKPIQPLPLPVAQLVAGMVQGGMPEFGAKILGEMYEAALAGLIQYDGTGERVRGATTLEEVVAELIKA